MPRPTSQCTGGALCSRGAGAIFPIMKRRKPVLREQLVVRIDRHLQKALETAAEQDRRTVSDFVRNLLADRVPEHVVRRRP